MGSPLLIKGNIKRVFDLSIPPMRGGGEKYIGQVNPRIVMVDRNQDVEEVVRNVRQDNLRGKNNLAHVVKNILT